MTLLNARTTNTSYPTDVALTRSFLPNSTREDGVDCYITLSGEFDGATFGYEVSADGGTTWTTGSYTATDAGWLTPFRMFPGWKIRPTVADAGASTSITALMTP